MVGYRNPCPICSNKRKRSPVERSESLPAPRSLVLVAPPPSNSARSISDLLPSSSTAEGIMAVTAQPQLSAKPSVSAGFPSSCAVVAPIEVDAGCHQYTLEPPKNEKSQVPKEALMEQELEGKRPSEASNAERGEQGSLEGSGKGTHQNVSQDALNGKNKLEEMEKAATVKKMRGIAELKVSKGVQIEIRLNCKCHACLEVVFN